MSQTKAIRWFQEDQVALFTPAELAENLEISSSYAQNIVGALNDNGFIQRIDHGVYSVGFYEDDLHPHQVVPYCFGSNAYVSLFSVFSEYNMVDDIPPRTTVVTQQDGSTKKTPLGTFRSYHMKPDHLWGYDEKPTRFGTRPIAQPEKAIADLEYLAQSPSPTLSRPGNWDAIVQQADPDAMKTVVDRFTSDRVGSSLVDQANQSDQSVHDSEDPTFRISTEP